MAGKKAPTKKSIRKKTKTTRKKISKKDVALGIEKKISTLEDIESTGNESLKPARYWEALGRRKRAVARVRLFTRGEKEAVVNKRPLAVYFSTSELQETVLAALKKMKSMERFRIVVNVVGGGVHSQAEAVRHATARALVKFNPDFRIRLRKAGYLTRDPREKERRKYGLKKARKAPQWQKR